MEGKTKNLYLRESALDPASVVVGNWPDALRVWTGGLMAGKLEKSPELEDSVWQSWLKSVEHHGLGPLLFSRLRSCETAIQPPVPILSGLRTNYMTHVAQIMVRRTQLDNLLGWLETAEIEALVMKGAALGESIYQDVFERPTADIDILISKSDFDSARKVLIENGFRSKRGERTGQMSWNCDEEFLPAVGDETRLFTVELHWALTSHVRILDRFEAGPLYNRSANVQGFNHPFRVLNQVDALVYACLHLFYKHINELRLIWIYDIHLLTQEVENLGLWDEVVALSQQWDARLALVHCLQLTHYWFETPCPEKVLDLDYKPPSLDEIQLFNLVMFQLEHGQREGWLKKHLFQLNRLRGWEKVHYLKSRLFPTRQEIEANYPGLRFWPGPLVHIGRLAKMIVSKR